mmetsp:Transcript_14013/g.26435  ORF Transcript_14013/g.26435 Transcript_14013/m.26435 type:complete len:337 (-) Transcript_14013:388-1398(-)
MYLGCRQHRRPASSAAQHLPPPAEGGIVLRPAPPLRLPRRGGRRNTVAGGMRCTDVQVAGKESYGLCATHLPLHDHCGTLAGRRRIRPLRRPALCWYVRRPAVARDDGIFPGAGASARQNLGHQQAVPAVQEDEAREDQSERTVHEGRVHPARRVRLPVRLDGRRSSRASVREGPRGRDGVGRRHLRRRDRVLLRLLFEVLVPRRAVLPPRPSPLGVCPRHTEPKHTAGVQRVSIPGRHGILSLSVRRPSAIAFPPRGQTGQSGRRERRRFAPPELGRADRRGRLLRAQAVQSEQDRGELRVKSVRRRQRCRQLAAQLDFKSNRAIPQRTLVWRRS